MGSTEARFMVPLMLDGKARVTCNTFDVISPFTNEPCWKAVSATEEDALAAVESAERAFETWRRTTPRQRRDVFIRARGILLERYEQSKFISQTETGAGDDMFGFEYHLATELLLFTAGLIPMVQGAVPAVDAVDSHAMVLKEPYGVVLAIAPWNAPHILGVRACIAPLAAGNTVVLKGPELSPRTYHNFVEALHEAGLPPGCLNTVYHRPSDAARITQLIIEHPAVQKVNFTGSSPVGSAIASLCGKNLKPCLMELGGKAPAIVCEDADLDHAARMCAFGAFHHSGQICMSTERILVFESITEAFKAKLKQALEAQANTSPAPMQLISEASASRNRGLIEDAISKGAKTVFRHHESEVGKSQLHPVILEDVTTDMNIYASESFGPSCSLFLVKSDEEAIRMANDTKYGLTSSVFTTNLARGFKYARQIVSGAVHINGPTIHDEAVLPHGGVKNSGFGRFSGKDCLDEWVRTKVVTWQE